MANKQIVKIYGKGDSYMSRKLKIVICVFTIVTFVLTSSVFALAQEDSGIIDFYTVFSKDDVNKNRVGNSVYNWSIYMPQDAYINKDPKGSYFSMSSNSYKANINVEAILNKEGYTSLDEILLYGQDLISGEYSGSKLYSLKKGKDKQDQEYIEATSVFTDSFYVFVDEEESSGTFNLIRIYLSKNKRYNYIYRLTISMDLNFYSQHKNLLYKIADSFETNFDRNNPNIKDLADNVTSWRVHKNTSYGWQIDLPPYWKSTDIYNLEYNSSTQLFAPLYTDEEMGISTQKQQQDTLALASPDSQQEYDEYLSVSFVTNSNISFDKWVSQEIKSIELYNKELLKVISSKSLNIGTSKAKIYDLRIRKSLNKTFVEKRLYVDSNNNKYVVRLYVTEEKYNKDKQKYERIINSFKVLPAKSRYFDAILWSGDLKPQNTLKTVKLNKAPFEMKISKDYKTNMPYYYYSYFSQIIASSIPSAQGISDIETVMLYNTPYSILTINGGINVDPAEKIIKNTMQTWVESNEYKSKAVNMNLLKYADKNLSIYKFTYVYNISKLSELAKGNPNRDFNFMNLQNRIIYMIKYNQYYYTIDLSIPVLYYNSYTVSDFENFVKSIKIDKIDFSKLNLKFVKEDLEKFKKKE